MSKIEPTGFIKDPEIVTLPSAKDHKSWIEVGKREKTKGKVNARLRCIFENGTESDMLLRSLSAELYKDGRRVKIGFSRVPVAERIKNAENETTYLMAPVEIIAEYKCFNMNPHRFEQLLHNFFAIIIQPLEQYICLQL